MTGELGAALRTPPHWRKSSYSAGNTDCVQVAVSRGTDAGVANKTSEEAVVVVGDSKNPHEPALAFTTAEWDAFVAGVKAGEFDTSRVLDQALLPAAGE